jgi:hypothetical protein
MVRFVGKLTDFKWGDVLLNAAAIYESHLGDVLTLIVVDGASPPGLADVIVGEIMGSTTVTKDPFAADYALKDFSWSGQAERMFDIYQEAFATSK